MSSDIMRVFTEFFFTNVLWPLMCNHCTWISYFLLSTFLGWREGGRIKTGTHTHTYILYIYKHSINQHMHRLEKEFSFCLWQLNYLESTAHCVPNTPTQLEPSITMRYCSTLYSQQCLSKWAEIPGVMWGFRWSCNKGLFLWPQE